MRFESTKLRGQWVESALKRRTGLAFWEAYDAEVRRRVLIVQQVFTDWIGGSRRGGAPVVVRPHVIRTSPCGHPREPGARGGYVAGPRCPCARCDRCKLHDPCLRYVSLTSWHDQGPVRFHDLEARHSQHGDAIQVRLLPRRHGILARQGRNEDD